MHKCESFRYAISQLNTVFATAYVSALRLAEILLLLGAPKIKAILTTCLFNNINSSKPVQQPEPGLVMDVAPASAITHPPAVILISPV